MCLVRLRMWVGDLMLSDVCEASRGLVVQVPPIQSFMAVSLGECMRSLRLRLRVGDLVLSSVDTLTFTCAGVVRCERG